MNQSEIRAVDAAIIHGAASYLLREVRRLDASYGDAGGWDVIADADGSARADRDEAWFLANALVGLLAAAASSADPQANAGGKPRE